MWHRMHNNESTQAEYRTQHKMILKTYIEKAKAKLSLDLSTRLLKDESYVPYERVAPPCEL